MEERSRELERLKKEVESKVARYNFDGGVGKIFFMKQGGQRACDADLGRQDCHKICNTT